MSDTTSPGRNAHTLRHAAGSMSCAWLGRPTGTSCSGRTLGLLLTPLDAAVTTTPTYRTASGHTRKGIDVVEASSVRGVAVTMSITSWWGCGKTTQLNLVRLVASKTHPTWITSHMLLVPIAKS